MRIHRGAAAMVLYGGWLLLFNPEDHRPNAPLSEWERVGSHDTAYECEQKRHEEALETAAKDAKPGESRLTPSEAELRYRCERKERFEPLEKR